MSHVRTQLREGAWRAILADGAFGDRVKAISSAHDVDLGAGPVCRVMTEGETSERASMKDPRLRTISLVVAAWAAEPELETCLDDLSARIEVAVVTDAALRALCVDLQYVSAETEITVEGAAPVGALEMRFQAVIVTAPNNPNQQET